MNVERWRQVDKILQDALELEPRMRKEFLDSACANDTFLREELQRLIQSYERAGSFLEHLPDISFHPRPAGTAIGPYILQEPLGVGGMGEVYRATDTRLGRTVAVKMVRDEFAQTPGFRDRIEREARTIASLNHPHVCSLYDVGEHEGVTYLVMEYVSGELLANVIKRGRLVPSKALRYAREIADALTSVHARGILHRDLKPGNVMITDNGVKVLDFGLAKFETAGKSTNSASATDATSEPGLILGTAAYMSPEQARGELADKRSDVWAFGCLLYEMLVGKRAFNGSGTTEILAAVLKTELDWSALPAGLAPSIYRLLRACLEKDVSHRIADVSTVSFLLDEPGSAATGSRMQSSWLRFAALSLIVLAATTTAATVVWRKTQPASHRLTQLNINTPAPAALTVNQSLRDLAIAPDGSRVVYVGNEGTQLFVRALDALEPVPLTPPMIPQTPFFSADGQWVGYFNGQRSLMKVPITGGPATSIVSGDPLAIGPPRGATWGPDGTVVFATASKERGLERVSAEGGDSTVITAPKREAGEDDHIWPEFLPGGQMVLFTITSTTGRIEDAQIAVLNLRTGKYKSVLRGGSHAHYLQTGHLMYGAAGTLRAIRFDLQSLETIGAPVPVLSRVVTTADGAADFDVALDGTLAYVSGGFQTVARSLLWVDRQGREYPIKIPQRAFVHPRLSPDGSRIAVDIRDQENDIWIWDIRRETLDRLTSDPETNSYPVWTLDGRVIYGLNNGPYNLYSRLADGTEKPKQLTKSSRNQFATAISPDGKWLVFNELSLQDRRNVMMLALDNPGHVEPLVQTPFTEQNGTISPDGRWLAYDSNDTGEFEIYVRPFPNVNQGHWRVSIDGGRQPVWRRNGKELFYWDTAGALMSVAVGDGSTWSAGTAVKVLGPGYYRANTAAAPTYDVSLDGRRFLVIKRPPDQNSTATSLVVVQNWFNELQRLVPR